MENLEWIYNRFGNVSRYTLLLVATCSPSLKCWIKICDDEYGQKSYFLNDIIKVVKEYQSRLVIATICLMGLSRPAVITDKPKPKPKPASKKSAVKRKASELHDSPESNERARITAKKCR